MRKLTTDNIAQIKPYVPGKPVEETMREYGLSSCVKLASNENPLGASPLALDAMKKAISELSRYPDSSGYYLTRKLSQVHDLPPEQFVLGNGSVEIIEMIARTFLGLEEDGIVSQHAFIMYWLAIQSVNGRVKVIPSKNHTHDLDAMAAAVTPQTKLMFIANPNNPTGTMVTREELDAFFAKIPEDVIVVLDEAYHEYIKDPSYPSGVDDLRKGRNVIVLRTFSKIYGLAGCRIGYGMATAQLVEALEKVRIPFNTSTLAQEAARAALDDTEHVERSYRANLRERSYLSEELDKLGISYVPSVANFLLVDFKIACGKVFEELLRRGVIVRPMAGYGFETSVRATVGTRSENESLIAAIRELQQAGVLPEAQK